MRSGGTKQNRVADWVGTRIHKGIIAIIVSLLGAALLDRDRVLFAGESINIGEILFGIYLLAYLLFKLASNPHSLIKFNVPYKDFSFPFLLFVAWTGLSWAINTIFIDGELHDLFGVTFRLGYYYVMLLFIAQWVRRYNPQTVIYPFCGSVLLFFFMNYRSAFIEAATLPHAINVTNFSGIMLPVCSLYFALLYCFKRSILTLLLAMISYWAAILVYSLGAYVSMAMALPVLIVIVNDYWKSKKYHRFVKYATAVGVIICAFYVINNFPSEIEIIKQFINNKINNLSFTEEGQQGDQSMDYRIGHFQSSLAMVAMNPLFGVGEFNWERENDKNAEWVRAYVANDNPHNAFAQVFSMYGIPAFIFFVWSIYAVFKKLFALRLLLKWKWKLFVSFTAITFIGGANTMSPFFNTYYFLIFAGVVFGIYDNIRHIRYRPGLKNAS